MDVFEIDLDHCGPMVAIGAVSGLVWVLLLTMSLSDEGPSEAVTSGALREVLNLTQFGLVSKVRSALAIALAICLALERLAFWRRLGLGTAVCLAASIAWTGHAGSMPLHIGVFPSCQRCAASSDLLISDELGCHELAPCSRRG